MSDTLRLAIATFIKSVHTFRLEIAAAGVLRPIPIRWTPADAPYGDSEIRQYELLQCRLPHGVKCCGDELVQLLVQFGQTELAKQVQRFANDVGSELEDRNWNNISETWASLKAELQVLAVKGEPEPAVIPPAGKGMSEEDTSPADTQPSKKSKGKNIDARMLKALADNREAFGWSARQWAQHFDCAESTVKETKTWKEHLKACRAEQAAEHTRKMDRSGLVRTDRPNRAKDDDESDE